MSKVLNYKYIIYPFVAIFLGCLAFWYSPPFVPDCFKIESYGKRYELFNLIIGSLVSIMGIYITVSLVAYEFFKQKSGVDFNKSFLINSLSAYYISFSVLTIIVAFLSSIIVPIDNLSANEISIIYFNIFLFVLIISFLIPVAFNLFSSLKPEKLASEEIDKIDSKSIFISNNGISDIDKSAEIFENDHLIKVTNIVIALISVSESIKAQLIIRKTTSKLSNLIIDGKNPKDKEYIIERLITFYIKIIDFALLQPNNAGILRCIWNSIESMYFDLIKKKETSFHYEKFREKFFERYISRLFTHNKEEEIIEGIETVKNIIQNQLISNMSEDKEILHLYGFINDFEPDFKNLDDYSDANIEDSKHWDEITHNTLDLFSIIINKSIAFKNLDLLNKCFEKLDELSFQIYLNEIGKYKSAFLHIKIATIISDYACRAFQKNVFEEGSDAKRILPIHLEMLIKSEVVSARMVLQKYCYLLIYLQKLNKLDRWFLGGIKMNDFMVSEGDLGHIARRCAYTYNQNKITQSCLDDCIETYIILKEYYESHKNDNFDLYMVLKDRLSSILGILLDCNVENESLIERLKTQIESFTPKEDYFLEKLSI
ncbi:hypothetical protein [Flavobacterium sp. M31R6]|uniref:hypothetical protein n=1 Tax=Flavobacterium sp. M31R6 TaxID=2739062 RepID=UPI0015699259|nr:hypothetical protein [Flavobacterium sp. M31R6]QKJ61738.1 hypothetical protein HQN62_00910 [Flavobacterium sp. M31R6]